jgi:predicted dehydrogenase
VESKSKSPPALRLAFIGGGINSAIGNAHRIASQLDGHWKLVCGVFSRDSHINSQSAATYGLKDDALCTNIDELIKRQDEFDAVSVLSPTNLHFEHISILSENKIRIITEKSMVANVREALTIIKQQEISNQDIYVTFNYTAYPMVRELKSRIQNQEIGKILFIQIEMPQESFLKLSKNLDPPNVQNWRKSDSEISTLSLDLGVHTQSLIHFVTGLSGIKFVGVKSHHGLVSNAVDYLSALGKYQDGVEVNVWYGKTALGNRNGLRIRIFGEHGSFEWEQIYPDRLLFANQIGTKQVIDQGSGDLLIANQNRYQRFKPGHPTGFIEAFANYYDDIYNVLSPFVSSDESFPYLLNSNNALMGLREIEAIEKSYVSETWEKV